MPKKWYESRIFWAQVLALLIVAAELLGGVKPDTETQQQAQQAIPAIIAIITLFLRFRTDQPIG